MGTDKSYTDEHGTVWTRGEVPFSVKSARFPGGLCLRGDDICRSDGTPTLFYSAIRRRRFASRLSEVVTELWGNARPAVVFKGLVDGKVVRVCRSGDCVRTIGRNRPFEMALMPNRGGRYCFTDRLFPDSLMPECKAFVDAAERFFATQPTINSPGVWRWSEAPSPEPTKPAVKKPEKPAPSLVPDGWWFRCAPTKIDHCRVLREAEEAGFNLVTIRILADYAEFVDSFAVDRLVDDHFVPRPKRDDLPASWVAVIREINHFQYLNDRKLHAKLREPGTWLVIVHGSRFSG